ncbi:MAG: hypothetical protein V1872_05515 [bacterium]
MENKDQEDQKSTDLNEISLSEDTCVDKVEEDADDNTLVNNYVPCDDSTAIQEIVLIAENDKGAYLRDEKLYQKLEDFIASIDKDDQVSEEEKINKIVALLEKVHPQLNISKHGAVDTYTIYAIKLGKVLNYLKKLIKKSNMDWAVWANQNIKSFSPSTRQNYMRLAKRTDCHPFYFLGQEKLLALTKFTRDIKAFFQKHKIKTFFNLEDKDEIEKFKLEVNAALATEKAQKIEVNLSHEQAKLLIDNRVKVDDHLLTDLSNIKEAGGDPNLHINKLILDRGVAESHSSSEPISKSCLKLIVELDETIESTMELNDPDKNDEIDPEKVREHLTLITKFLEFLINN